MTVCMLDTVLGLARSIPYKLNSNVLNRIYRIRSLALAPFDIMLRQNLLQALTMIFLISKTNLQNRDIKKKISLGFK